ncbi:hypothetical protein ACEPAF_8964 [Sanghuangporus sanghuang]
MPGTSRTQQKAEARYNVTTQFPQYDLHFAAASGNLGLVEFALSHGQPINSVLNGVLPLHAACAGGSEVVVKYLIDEGADVNAPRIPRRYSNEKHKSSGLAVGASGSTPLHFAAANGHLGVVKLLLAHGAVPDRADKHGVTPEMLARNTGWVECADILAAWSGGRAGDLPPVQPGGKEEASGPGSVSGPNYPFGSRGNGSAIDIGNTNTVVSSTGEKEKDKDGCEISEMVQSGSRRLHMKRSIDNALHLFKTPLLHHHGSHGQLRDRERERDKSPPSPSAAAHPQSQSQSHPHSHSILPLHHYSHHHQHSHSHSHGGSPSSHSHLHSLFHHGHSHSTSQLQTQASSQSQPQSQSTSQSASVTESALFRPSLSTGASATSSSSLHPNSNSNLISSPFDGLGAGVPGNRRPSLPHIFNEPASPFQRRLSGRKRRPRSAGSDAGQEGSANAENGNGNANSSGNANGVSRSGSRLAAVGMTSGYSSGYSSGYPTNLSNTNVNTGTGTTRKLSSKISLRNLFRRAGGEPSVSSNTNLNANANANSSLNLSGSEPGSGSASASTSFSNSAPIYNHAFSASAGARGTASPPASPLSASFAPSPPPMSGGGGRPGSWYRQRIGSEGAGSVPVPRSPLVPSAVELHHRYSQEQLHEEFEDEAAGGVATTGTDGLGDVVPGSAPGPGMVAPRLSARPSILRGQGQSGSHNRSASSQSSSGTGTPGGTRTLRFDATASPAETSSMSPEPRWGSPVGASVGMGGNASAIRLRGTRSASSLRHEHSYGYDEDEEDEEEDYGTSIDPSESTALRYDDAELEESTTMLEEGEQGVDPSTEAVNYAQYVSAGRARGASFASTASSSSPGVSPENRNAGYERNEFPFSIDGPPPRTPVSVTSEASVTTRYSLPDDALLEGDNKDATSETKERVAESRARGESFSSVETDRSEPSQADTSSTSNLITPSPGTDLRMTSILSGDDNDTEVPTDSMRMRDDSLRTTNAKETSNDVCLHASPSSSLEELGLSNADGQESPEQLQRTKNAHSPTTPTPLPPDLDLRGISNLAEAEALVRRAQQAILASASLPADGPESPDVPLSAQLAAYGEILALERRFARGEKQRELWSVRDDSDGEAEVVGGSEQHNASANESGEVKTPKSAKEAAKEARMALTQKKRDVAVLRQRGATTDAAVGLALGPGASSLRQRPPARPAKQKRPHTAEGAPQASWGFSSPAASTSCSPTAADTTVHSTGTSPTVHAHSHSQSTSTPLYISKESEKLPDIAIIETTATPIDSPETTPDSVAPRISPSPSAAAAPPADHDYPSTRYTIDDTRPSLPLRSRTPDPDPSASTDDFGVPLTRVATAPLQDSSAGYGSGSGSYNARGSSSVLRSDPTTRRTGAAHKLSKMGFAVDAASHHHHASHSNSGHGHHYRSHRQKEIQDAYSISPASSAGSSRSPSKARFGGIRSLVKGLKGKS